jgi:hypothetical protein
MQNHQSDETHMQAELKNPLGESGITAANDATAPISPTK